MSQVLNSIGSYLPDPRKLFLAAAALGLAALAMGYVEYHDRADRELALRQGPPPEVALQDFNPSRHTGPTGEFVIRTEVGFDQAIVLSLPGAEPPRRALLAPLYPLSEMGQALIDTQADGTRTALTAQVARRTGGGTEVRQSAIGLLFHPLEPGEAAPVDPSALTIGSYGTGKHGQVVALNGLTGDPDGLGLMAAGAFAASGTGLAAGFLAVQPFAEGREAGLSAISDSRSYLVPAVLALALALVGIATGLRGAGRGHGTAWDETGVGHLSEDIDGEQAAHPKFAPIPSQREIVEAANARGPEAPNWMLYYGAALLRGLWTVLKFLGGALVFCVIALKNRLSHREDEAL